MSSDNISHISSDVFMSPRSVLSAPEESVDLEQNSGEIMAVSAEGSESENMPSAVSVVMGVTGTLFSVATSPDKFAKEGAKRDLTCECWESILCHCIPNSYRLLCILTPGILYLFAGVMALTSNMDYTLFTWIGIKLLYVTFWFMLWGYLDSLWFWKLFWPYNTLFVGFIICQYFWPQHVLRLCHWVISCAKQVGAKVVFCRTYIWNAIVVGVLFCGAYIWDVIVA